MRALAIIALVVGAAACRDLLGFEDPRVAGTFPDDAFTEDSSPIDSPLQPCDPAACAAVGGACTVDVCAITGGGANIVCPGGLRCRITCDQSCGDIDCQPGSSCDVDCIGVNACQQSAIACRMAASCTIRCQGDNACQAGVSCEGGATCALDCDGQNACGAITTAGGATCTATCCNGGCTGPTGRCTIDTATCGGD